MRDLPLLMTYVGAIYAPLHLRIGRFAWTRRYGLAMPRGRFRIETASAAMWEYRIVEEPNPVALEERLGALAKDGWEPINMASAIEHRLFALLRRRVPVSNTSEQGPRTHV